MVSKHLIFFVHGMGQFTADWWQPYVAQLRKSYATYPSLAFDGFDDLFECIGVNYDGIFEEHRERWKNNRVRVTEALVANGFQKPAGKKLLDIASATEGDDFLRTHVLDVILYRFLPTIAEQIRTRVMKIVQVARNEYASQDLPTYTIIAHSLGTAVICESMHEWMTEGGWRGTGFASRFRPQNIFMVANCSRILWSLGGAFYRNSVRPFPIETKGACAYYGCYAHPLDPFMHVRPFDPPPDRWFFPGADPGSVYGCPSMAVDDIQQVNVHALDHYLAHPLVHVDMFRRLRRDPRLIPDEELKQGLKDYYKSTLSGQKLAQVRKSLSEFTISDAASWAGILESITGFRQLVSRTGCDT